MLIFKGHKISVNQLLGIILEALLAKLSETTKVDYDAKVLHGKKNVLPFIIWYFRKRKT